MKFKTFMAGVLLVGHFGVAQALTVSYQYTAQVTSVGALTGTGVSAGDIVTGTIVYDTNAPELSSSASQAQYKPAIPQFTFSLGALSGSASAGLLDNLTVLNDFSASPWDGLQFNRSLSGAAVSGWSPSSALLTLNDSSATALAGVSIPAAVLLSAFDTRTLQLGFASSTSSSAIQAQLLSLTPVPLPAAAWLFGSALLGLGLMRRRGARVPAV